MVVDATTELGFKRPTATGFLSFKKKEFANDLAKTAFPVEQKPKALPK
jgi:hypothetical protein